VDLSGTKAPVYLVGSVPGDHAGPWAITSGRAAVANDEIVISPVLASRYRLHLGGTLSLMGATFHIVGYAGDAAAFMTSFVFVTHAATDSLLRAPGTTSYVLIGTTHPAAVQARLTARGLNVLTRAQVAGSDRKLLTGIFGGVLGFMAAIAFAAGTLIIALAAYTAVTERRREYGIIKALGATRRRLIGLALVQTFGVALLGLTAGGLLFVGGRALIVAARPQFEVLASAASLARVAVATAVMALAAAVVPARRLAALDPASAYGGG
jgi:putative ABC transport system permease protein